MARRILPFLFVLTACPGEPPLVEQVTTDPPLTDPAAAYLIVQKHGDGMVRSSESPPKIECGDDCFSEYRAGATVTLSAQPADGWLFSRFEGDDDCVNGKVTVRAQRHCVAHFVPADKDHFALSLRVRGEGSVFYDSLPNKPGCHDHCVRTLPFDQEVEIKAQPRPGWAFSHWEGHLDCRDGHVSMEESKRCIAVFGFDPDKLRRLLVEVEGFGHVEIDGEQECTGSCLRNYVSGESVSLSAVADREKNARFIGWSDPSCADGSVTLDQDVRCKANFEGGQVILNLFVGYGGEVRTAPAINVCRDLSAQDEIGDTPCATPFRFGETALLEAVPDAGFELAEWGGDCNGRPMTLTRNASCWVRFRPLSACAPFDAPPSAPKSPRAFARSCDSVGVAWERPEEGCADGYEVYRFGRKVADLAANQTSFVEDGYLWGDTNYEYTVRAIGPGGVLSTASQVASVRTTECPALPSRIDIKVLLVKFPDIADEPISLEDADFQMFGQRGSVNTFFQEVSYGETTLAGDSHGWFVMPEGAEAYCDTIDDERGPEGCDLFRILSDIGRLVDSEVDFTGADRVVVYLNDIGDFGGAAGGVMVTDEGTFSPMVTLSAKNGRNLTTIAHELGHTYRMLHAGSIQCERAPVSDDHGDLLTGGCQTQTYGDPIDPMGHGLNHFSSYHKRRMGMLPEHNVALANDPGEYLVEQLEVQSDGTKMLIVPLDGRAGAGGDFYFLELRRPVGADSLSTLGRGVDAAIVRLGLGYAQTPSSDTLIPIDNWRLTTGFPFYDPALNMAFEPLAHGEEAMRLRIVHDVF